MLYCSLKLTPKIRQNKKDSKFLVNLYKKGTFSSQKENTWSTRLKLRDHLKLTVPFRLEFLTGLPSNYYFLVSENALMEGLRVVLRTVSNM